MNNHNPFVTFSVAMVTGIAVIVFLVTFVHASLYAPESATTAPSSIATASAPINSVPLSEQPARLIIPALHIDANIQYVGVKANNSMGTPNNFTDVAWYKYGTVPGEIGSAVIDGHVDNGLALPGVFKHLGDIKVGDDVYIQTKQSTNLHFIVDHVMIYPYKAVPLDLLFDRNDQSWLNLVTCEGNWVKGEKTYDQRLIVYTKYVGSSLPI